MKAVPKNWHWKITPSQIARIGLNDRETINFVYFDNLPKFRKLAVKYCYHAQDFSFLEDCIQQIYIDLPRYDYTNTKTLFYSIKKSFRRASGLKRIHFISLNEPVTEDESRTVADYLEVDGFAELEEKEQDRNVLSIIAEQTHLTEIQRDQLTAFAFGVALYRGLFAYEYKQAYSS